MKTIKIIFASKKLDKEFDNLIHGKFEDKKLHKFITRAFQDLKENPYSGIKIPKRLWPKEYIISNNITNLFKYDLPSGWRLIYHIKTNEIEIFKIILEWFNHKNYERKFKY